MEDLRQEKFWLIKKIYTISISSMSLDVKVLNYIVDFQILHS